MFNCQGVFPISKCSGGDLKRNLRLNQKQSRLSSSEHTTDIVSLTVINNGKDYAEKQNNRNNPYLCLTNVGGPGDHLSSMFRFNNKMRENTNGLDKKHSSYHRYLARKKGWNLLNQNCVIDNSEHCLPQKFTFLTSDTTNFNIDIVRPSNTTFVLNKGNYLIKGISEFYGIIITDADDTNMIKLTPVNNILYNTKITNVASTYAADLDANIPDNTRFYYGDIILEVLGDFGKASIFEYYNGYKNNGQNLLKFDTRCL